MAELEDNQARCERETAEGFRKLSIAVEELARSLEVPGESGQSYQEPLGILYIHAGDVALLPKEYRAWATKVDQS